MQSVRSNRVRYFNKKYSYLHNIRMRFAHTYLSLLSLNHIKELSWIVIGQVLTLIIGLVTMKLLTNMGMESFGEYSLVLSVSALLMSMFYGPLEQGVIRFYHEILLAGNSKVLIGYFNSLLLFLFFTLFLLGNLYYLFFQIGKDYSQVILITGVVIFAPWSLILNSILNLLRYRRLNTLIQVLEKTSFLLLLLYFDRFNKLSLRSTLFSLFFVSIIFVILKYIIIRGHVKVEDSNRNALVDSLKFDKMEFLYYITPFIFWGSLYWVQSNSEKWVILKYVNAEQVGLFAVISLIANYCISMPIGILTQLVSPIMLQRMAQRPAREALNVGGVFLNYLFISIGFLTIMASILGYFFQQDILNIVASNKYVIDTPLLSIICLGLGFFNIGQVAANVGLILKKPRIYIFPKIFAGIVSLLLNILLLNYLGLLGIALSILISSLVYMLHVILVNKKVLSVKALECV
jgi:O-antigen/teichoic acid export membrane protein